MDFDSYFRASPLAGFAHERRAGGQVPTRAIRCWSPAHDSVDPPTDDLVIGLMLGGRGGARWAWDGAKANETRARRRGTLGVTPPGAVGSFEVGGPSAMLIVALPLTHLMHRLDPDFRLSRDFGPLHDAYRDHPYARSLCARLWRAIGQGPALDPLVDAIAETLLVTLSRAAPTARAGAGRLSAAEVRHVLDRAAEETADVDALALSVAMPVRTFRRRFSASFGVSPHMWLIQRRIDRAEAALRSTTQPIADLAAELGFSSQAHLTTWFTRRYGRSPARYRKALSQWPAGDR